MAIEIREFVGAEAVHFKQAESDRSIVNLQEAHVDSMVSEDSIMVDIEGIHSKITRNYTYYEPDCLKESVPGWTQPYERPVIMHHNEKDGVIIGRIKAVEYTDKNTRSGTPALIFTTNIAHEEGKRGVKDGTLATVSIGAIAHDVRCSVCGANLAEYGLCEHEKGETYDGKLCYWIIKKMEPKELSYVIVPSDIYAHNLRVYKPQQAPKLGKVVGESTYQSEVNKSMYENPFADLIEATKVEPKKEEKPAKEDPKDESQTKEQPKEEPKAEEAKKEEQEVPTKKVDIDEEVKKDDEGTIDEEGEENKPKEEAPKSDEKEDEAKEDEKKEDPKDDKSDVIKELKKQIEDLSKEVEDLHKKIADEKGLRESAEKELLTFRLAKKKELVENINSLRANLNLQAMNAESLMESTDESLQITLSNLKEFAEAKASVVNIPQVKSNVAVSEEADNTCKSKSKKDVKEDKVDSNIDLVEAYTEIFNNIW